MINRHFLLIVLFVIFLPLFISAQSQEYIVKINLTTHTYRVKDLIIAGNYAKFYDVEEECYIRKSTDEFISLDFSSDDFIEIHSIDVLLDTIDCIISSIDNSKVHYRDPQTSESSFVDKNEVVLICFNGNCPINNQIIDIDELKKFHLNRYQKAGNIFYRDGSSEQFGQLKSIAKDSVYFEKLKNGGLEKGRSSFESIIKIQLKESKPKSNLLNNGNYILGNEGNWIKVIAFSNLDKDTVIVRMESRGDVFDIPKEKRKMPLSTFTDFSQIETANIIQKKKQDLTNKVYKKFKIEINGGLGIRTMPVDEGSSPEFEEYINKLRQGYVLEFAFSYFILKHLGVGLYCSTYNSVEKMTNRSEDIQINFYAPEVIFSRTIFKDHAHLYAGGSIGLMTYKNHLIMDNSYYAIKGENIGLRVGAGLDVNLGKNLCVGFKGNVFLSYLNTITVNNQEVDDDFSQDLSRIDLLGSIKFYF